MTEEKLDRESLMTELNRLYNCKPDESYQFTREQMLVAISHGIKLGRMDSTQSSLSEDEKEELNRLRRMEESFYYIYKWVERGLFNTQHTTPTDALLVIAHHPTAPWNKGPWDVTHKPYATQFYKKFPYSKVSKS